MKKLLVGVLVVIVLVIAGLFIAVSLIDTNRFKQPIVQNVEAKLGGKFNLEGISISPFPTIQFKIRGIDWQKPEAGLKAHIDTVILKIPYHELLRGAIDTTLVFKKPTVELIRASSAYIDRNGQAPYRLASAPDTTTPPKTPESSRTAAIVRRIVVKKFSIAEGAVLVQTGETKSAAVENIALSIGPLALDESKVQKIDIDFNCDVTEGPLKGPVALFGNLEFNLPEGTIRLNEFSLELWKEKLEATGEVRNFRRENVDDALLTLQLKNSALDIQKWLSVKNPEQAKDVEGAIAVTVDVKDRLGSLKTMSQQQKISPTLEAKIDLDFPNLKIKGERLSEGKMQISAQNGALSGNGRIALATLRLPEKKIQADGIQINFGFQGSSFSEIAAQVNPVTISTIALEDPALTVNKLSLTGKYTGDTLTVDNLSTELLGGTLHATGEVSQLKTTPRLAILADASNLDLAMLPQKSDKKPDDYRIGGIARFELSATASGSQPQDLQNNLNATGSFDVADLPLPAIDLKSKLGDRQIPALLAPKINQKIDTLIPAVEKIVSVNKLQSLSGQIAYHGGAMTLSKAVAKNVNYNVHMDGTVSKDRTLDMAGELFIIKERSDELVAELQLAKGLTLENGQMRFPFTVTGPLDTPETKLNYQEIVTAMIQSGALQEAVKEQGKAIRETVEQIRKGEGAPLKDVIKKQPKKILENFLQR